MGSTRQPEDARALRERAWSRAGHPGSDSLLLSPPGLTRVSSVARTTMTDVPMPAVSRSPKRLYCCCVNTGPRVDILHAHNHLWKCAGSKGQGRVGEPRAGPRSLPGANAPRPAMSSQRAWGCLAGHCVPTSHTVTGMAVKFKYHFAREQILSGS